MSWKVIQSYEQDVICALDRGWSNGEIVRATPGRRVIIVRAKRCHLVVKQFYGGFARDLKGIFRGSPAAREWRALHEAKNRGLPIPQPVAVGARHGLLGRESFLMTEALEASQPVANYLFGGDTASAPERWKVIKAVAEMLRRAHDIGFCQRDLHLGNILVRIIEDRREIFFIDLQRSSNFFPLDESRRWENLAVLHGGCVGASRTDRLRFLKHYLTRPVPLSVDLRELVAQLQREGLRHRFKIWRAREKRCLAENREFVPISTGAFRGFARREQWADFLASLVQNPEDLLQVPGARLVKGSKTTTVAVAGPTARRFFIKRYNYQGAAYAIKDLFRSSRARRAWMAANSLHMRGIPVALPLAYLEKRRWGVLRESYVLTEAIMGDSVRDIFRRYDKQGSPLEEKRIFLRDLGRLLKKMHASGVAHRDLKGTNIIAQKLPEQRYALHIVDFDGVSLGPVSRYRRIKNLARAAEECRRHSCLTRTDRLRFLKSYLGAKEAKAWRAVWRAIAKRGRGRVVSSN